MLITLIKGDITRVVADAIVNAANTSLLGGGGVDGAIHRKGGPAILDECRAIRARQGGCKVGEAVITTAGNLAARHVIHTVGPRWNEGQSQEPQKLADCYRSALALAEAEGLKSIAFPNISTGIYGYPKEEAARVALEVMKYHIPGHLTEILFVCFDKENHDLYRDLLSEN